MTDMKLFLTQLRYTLRAFWMRCQIIILLPSNSTNMSYRYMRILVFFDLPVQTAYDRKEYRRFRKFLIESGFLMLQESVYCKLVQNSTVADAVSDNVKRNRPSNGLVQLLRITEKQFSRMELIVGERQSEVLDTDERLVII